MRTEHGPINRELILRMKRLRNELKSLRKKPIELADAYPEDEHMLRWNFILFGPEDTDFAGGEYYGRIVLPPQYPNKAPDFYMLTPSGRFLINKKICLSNSSYHSSEWTPSWSIKTILVGMLSIMTDDFENGISHIHQAPAVKKQLAQKSHEFNQTQLAEIYSKMEELKLHRQKVFGFQNQKKEDLNSKDGEKDNNSHDVSINSQTICEPVSEPIIETEAIKDKEKPVKQKSEIKMKRQKSLRQIIANYKRQVKRRERELIDGNKHVASLMINNK